MFGVFVPPTEAIAPNKVVQYKEVINLSQAERNLLARLVYAEGRGESLEGQIAIAAVVINRMQSSHFPDDLQEVVYQKNAFSCIQDGQLSSQADDTAHQAVQAAVNGQDPSKGSLYYFNPNTATSSWIWSRPQAVKIGNHIFAK